MMKRLVLVALLAAASVSIFAQGFRGGGMASYMSSPSALLRRDDVRTELQLSDEQKNKLAEIASDVQSKMQEARESAGEDRDAMMKAMQPILEEANTKVLTVLTPDQQKRLKEIKYQISGYSLLTSDKELQAQLKLTDAQKSKIDDLNKLAQAANQSVGEKMRNHDIEMQDAMTAFKKNGDALNSAIEGVLTADQKASFKALQGKTFTQTTQPGFGFRGGGGGGGR